VFEPYQGGLGPVVPLVWQKWGVDAGLFWSTRTVTCPNGVILGGAGGPAIHTLAAVKAACPNAAAAGFGVNIGSNNPGYNVETDLVRFNATTYDFELYSTPDDKDECKKGGWSTFNPRTGPYKNQGQCVSASNHDH
jgi:hypothetical protein